MWLKRKKKHKKHKTADGITYTIHSRPPPKPYTPPNPAERMRQTEIEQAARFHSQMMRNAAEQERQERWANRKSREDQAESEQERAYCAVNCPSYCLCATYPECCG